MVGTSRCDVPARVRAGGTNHARGANPTACCAALRGAPSQPVNLRFNAETPKRPRPFDSPLSGSRFSLSPKGEGRGEGEKTLETPMRLRTADEFNYVRSMTPPRLTRVARILRKKDTWG